LGDTQADGEVSFLLEVDPSLGEMLFGVGQVVVEEEALVELEVVVFSTLALLAALSALVGWLSLELVQVLMFALEQSLLLQLVPML
jgi:hypothetical protein